MCVYLCVQLWAKSGHHGDLLNQGLLNDTSGRQKSHTNTHTGFTILVRTWYCQCITAVIRCKPTAAAGPQVIKRGQLV